MRDASILAKRIGSSYGKRRISRARRRSTSASMTPLPTMIAMPTNDQRSGIWREHEVAEERRPHHLQIGEGRQQRRRGDRGTRG